MGEEPKYITDTFKRNTCFSNSESGSGPNVYKKIIAFFTAPPINEEVKAKILNKTMAFTDDSLNIPYSCFYLKRPSIYLRMGAN
jgi:hypothetical protein